MTKTAACFVLLYNPNCLQFVCFLADCCFCVCIKIELQHRSCELINMFFKRTKITVESWTADCSVWLYCPCCLQFFFSWFLCFLFLCVCGVCVCVCVCVCVWKLNCNIAVVNLSTCFLKILSVFKTCVAWQGAPSQQRSPSWRERMPLVLPLVSLTVSSWLWWSLVCRPFYTQVQLRLVGCLVSWCFEPSQTTDKSTL